MISRYALNMILADSNLSQPGDVSIGWKYIAYTVAVSVASIIGVMIVGILLQKFKTNRYIDRINKFWLVNQAIVSHVEAELRPVIKRSLEDNELSEPEKKEIKAKAMELLKAAMGKELSAVLDAVGVSGTGIDVFISGYLERALRVVKAEEVAAGMLGKPATPVLSKPVALPPLVAPLISPAP